MQRNITKTHYFVFLWGLDDSNWGLQGILKFGLTISKVQLICLINVADFSAGYSWNVYKDILMQLNFILIDLNAAKLSTACFECYWTVTGSSWFLYRILFLSGLSTEWLESYWPVLNVAELWKALAQLFAGWFLLYLNCLLRD